MAQHTGVEAVRGRGDRSLGKASEQSLPATAPQFLSQCRIINQTPQCPGECIHIAFLHHEPAVTHDVRQFAAR